MSSVISRFSDACVAGVSGVFTCLCVERFQLLVCRALSVACVSSVFSCSCVERFQLLVCRALSVARVSSFVSCLCVERCQLHTYTYITFLYPRILRVAYAANFSEHLTIR